MNGNLFPKLYSFISLRREAFGGFLFNPYLMKERLLSSLEMDVAQLCDGSRTYLEIVGEIANNNQCDTSDIDALVKKTLEECSSYYALHWQSKPSAAIKSNAVTSDSNIWREDRLSAPLSVLWELTYTCNLHCRHCLTSCGNERRETWQEEPARRLIDELAEMKVFSMTLGGGEPLMHPHIFNLIQYGTEKNLNLKLSTNGMLVSDDTLRKIDGQNVFAAQVSVDGLKNTHDYLRGKSGSFDKAVGALELFAKAGMQTIMTVTASPANCNEIPQLADLAAQTGISTLKVGICASLGRATSNSKTMTLAPDDFSRLVGALQQKEAALGTTLNFDYDGLFPWLLQPAPLPTAKTQITTGPGCSAGISTIVISPEGEVFPCPYIRGMSAGTVYDQSLKEIWQSEQVLGQLRDFDQNAIEGKCRDCAYRPELCNGGCRGIAYAASGNLYAEDPGCWL